MRGEVAILLFEPPHTPPMIPSRSMDQVELFLVLQLLAFPGQECPKVPKSAQSARKCQKVSRASKSAQYGPRVPRVAKPQKILSLTFFDTHCSVSIIISLKSNIDHPPRQVE